MADKRPHTLSLQTVTGGGFDNDGNPVKIKTFWSEAVSCKYKRSLVAKVIARPDGNTSSYSYTITVDRDDMDGLMLKDGQPVRLYDEDENMEVEGQVKGFAKSAKTVKICL